MKRTSAVLLLGAVVVAAVGCGSVRPSGVAVHPSTAKARMFARAVLRQADEWGDPHPTNVVVVPTTRRAALRIEYSVGGISATPATPAYLVVAHGHFVAKDAPRPPGAASPAGTILTLTFDATTNRSLGVGLLRKAHSLERVGTPERLPLAAPPSSERSARTPRISYRLVGLTLTPAPAGYRPGVSRTAVLHLFQRSGLLEADSKSKPTIHLWTVGDGRPADGGSPSWVLTFRHTVPTSLGVPKTPSCTTVAIYDLSVGVWTWDFQSCGRGSRASCDAGCTPANQSALDAAANYAESVAGAVHVFTGVVVDDAANTVVVYLAHAPQSILVELRARHPGIYVTHNNAPRTLSAVKRLQNSLDWKALKSQGIDVNSTGPTQTGYLQVGVSSNVAKAQAFFDAQHGHGIIRVVHAEPSSPAIASGPVLSHLSQGVVRVLSSRAHPANAAELKQWRKKPLSVESGGSVLAFVSPGDGCKPRVVSARITGTTLTLQLRPGGERCTDQTLLYELTVRFAKPVLGDSLRRVVARYGTSHKPLRMGIARVVYG